MTAPQILCFSNMSSGDGDMLVLTTKKKKEKEKIPSQSGDKLQWKAIGQVFGRAQFVGSNKGDWCSAVWARRPIAGQSQTD